MRKRLLLPLLAGGTLAAAGTIAWLNREAIVADYVDSTLNDTLKRVPGVGSTQLFGAGYAMRIWLDPDRLQKYALMPSDVPLVLPP